MLEPPPTAVKKERVLYIKNYFDPISTSFLSVIFFLDPEMASPKFVFLGLTSIVFK